MNICPSCLREYSDYPAISRRDNRTEICSECGTFEAMYQFSNDGELPLMKCEIVDRFMDEFVNGYSSAVMYIEHGVSVNVDEFARRLVTKLVREHVEPKN